MGLAHYRGTPLLDKEGPGVVLTKKRRLPDRRQPPRRPKLSGLIERARSPAVYLPSTGAVDDAVMIAPESDPFIAVNVSLPPTVPLTTPV